MILVCTQWFLLSRLSWHFLKLFPHRLKQCTAYLLQQKVFLSCNWVPIYSLGKWKVRFQFHTTLLEEVIYLYIAAKHSSDLKTELGTPPLCFQAFQLMWFFKQWVAYSVLFLSCFLSSGVLSTDFSIEPHLLFVSNETSKWEYCSEMSNRETNPNGQ